MNDDLLWGAAGAVLLVLLLLVVQLIRRRERRPAAGVERVDRSARRSSPPLSRSASQIDTVSDVHELNQARRPASDDAGLRAEREVAERAARAEANREAAEWEARLVAQQLADKERERARVVADLAAASVVAPPPAGPESDPKVDEQAALDALAREAAEWETRLAAQQLADRESERQRLVAEAEAEAEAERAAAAATAAAAAEAQAAEAAAFHFTLEPEPAPEPAPKPPPAAPAVRAARTPQHCLVMIADDSKVVRIKTSRLLAKHLYRVSLAEDGLDAARQIELDLPDVLITDVERPGMDGFELTRQVRANPRTAHIPIVMITADDVKHRADAFEAGVSVLLSKPYPEDQLLSYLQSTLTGAAAAS